MRRIEKPEGMSLKGSEAIQQPKRRLDSWKAIAAYVGRSEKTVRRWENSEGLPVHRLIHEKRNSVYAFTDELDAWWEVRAPGVESGPRGDATWIRRPPAETVPSSMGWATRRLRPLLVALLTMAILCLLALAAIRLPRIRDKGNRPPSEARIRSLAVLPLENLSGDPNQEFFTDGMTAELITEMAKIKSLRVISRSSAMRYKGSRKPLQTIAGELGVDAIVEGEVLQSQRRVRVTAQLIQAATDSHLWSETYERDLRKAVAWQGEVAEAIARAIRVNLTPEEHAQLGGVRRVNAEAYEAYLKGRFFWSKRTEAGLEKSIDYYHLAISKDPKLRPSIRCPGRLLSIVGSSRVVSKEGRLHQSEGRSEQGPGTG